VHLVALTARHRSAHGAVTMGMARTHACAAAQREGGREQCRFVEDRH
jgi:hypothetical protein